MLSLTEFERMTEIDDEKLMQSKHQENLNKLNVIDPISSRQFFITYRNRYMIFNISSFLSDYEKINLLYLNRFTFTNLKRMFNQSGYNELKTKLVKLVKEGYTIRQLLNENASILSENLRIETLYETKEDIFAAINLIGKWLNRLFFHKKIKVIHENETKTEIVENIEVDLSNAKIKHLGAQFLFFIMAHNSSIENIDISNNSIEANTLKYLKLAMRKTKNLKYLDVHGNNIGNANGIEYFVQLFKKLDHLILLNISDIGLNLNSALILGKHLVTLNLLETLYLDKNDLTTKGCSSILNSCALMKNLQLLSLSETGLNPEIATPLKDFFLKKVSGLRNLDISNNYLGDFFCRKLSSIFPDVKLKNLNLSKCEIHDQGFINLLSSLKYNETLSHLNFSFNYLNYTSTSHIFNYISSSQIKKITLLDIIESGPISIFDKKKNSKELGPTLQYFKTGIKEVKEKMKTLYGRNKTIEVNNI